MMYVSLKSPEKRGVRSLGVQSKITDVEKGVTMYFSDMSKMSV
jgi:hypothetical protein